MIRFFAVMAFVLCHAANAQDFSGLARLDVAQSQIGDADGALRIDLQLSQAVPYRVFTQDSPKRLIIDFQEVDFTGASRAGLLNTDLADDVFFGPLYPGWSRMVVRLAGPMAIAQAGMQVTPDTGRAKIRIQMQATDDIDFSKNVGAPSGGIWDQMPLPKPQVDAAPDGPMVIAIDPGHGGIDSGAAPAGVREADLMLALGIELADAINRTQTMRAVLTRNADYFVALEQRMTLARQAHADALISLHADALAAGDARGASVYTLAKDAFGGASQRMAERHEQGDLVAGLDLQGQGDRITGVLMDLARHETGPAGEALADALVRGLRGAGVPLHPRPRRYGQLAVLNAPDFASVLLEAGFLTNASDRAALSDPLQRANWVNGIVAGLENWAQLRAANAPLIRQ